MNKNLKIIYFRNDARDETIQFIKELMNTYQATGIKVKKMLAKNQNESFKKLVNRNNNISYSIFVFGGHGKPDALWAKKQIFYNDRFFELGPKCLFAFCCHSARELGKSFAEMKPESFLGFNSYLPFDADDDFLKRMQEIFHPVISEIFRNGIVSESVYSIAKKELKDAERYYKNRDFLKALCFGVMSNSLRRY